MQGLKLQALDAQDLEIISAHMQDAVLKIANLEYLPRQKQFILTANRFNWELAEAHGELTRRACVLHFSRVEAVQARGLARQQADQVLALLSISFEVEQEPSGFVIFTFAGGASLRLQVECIEARLVDGEAEWATSNKPDHAQGKED